MAIGRVKYRLNKTKFQGAANVDGYFNVNLESEIKLLPPGKINRIVNVGDIFDAERQVLRVIPEPSQSGSPYYGVVACKMLKPIKDLVSQLWVYKYTMAQIKENIGHIRGKYSGTILFGGQTVNAQDIMSQGVTEKLALETQMVTNGYDAEPPKFFIG
jgi:hypothetical protein